MKYIRTKENLVTPWSNEQKHYIYKVEEMDNSISFVRPGISITFSKNSKDSKGLDAFLNNVTMQADTIEELCDEFIVFGDIDRPYLTRHKFINKEWNKQYFIGGKKLYGAIWIYDSSDAPTLKSVAKMNNKGELELL